MAQLSGVSSWYWPNPGTEANVALQYVLHPVKQLTCCDGIAGNCCDKVFPDLCLCEDLVNQRDFLNCPQIKDIKDIVSTEGSNILLSNSRVSRSTCARGRSRHFPK